MNTDVQTLVKLKYQIITSDTDTWHICDTYPKEVLSKWAWRCAADVEHLADGYPEAMECIRVAKAYRDGLATREEVDKAWHCAASHSASHSAVNAAYASAMTAADTNNAASTAATVAIGAATRLPLDTTTWQAVASANCGTEFNKYIGWLVEELCEYEIKSEYA